MEKHKKNIFSKRKSSWVRKATYRLENKKWLEYSAMIALRIHSIIDNDEDMKQTEIAEKLNVSRQQVNKILKGEQNLTLKTIGRLSDVLDFELISFPPYKDSFVLLYDPKTPVAYTISDPNENGGKIIHPLDWFSNAHIAPSAEPIKFSKLGVNP